MPKKAEDPTPNNPIAEQVEIIGTVDTYAIALSAVVELMEAARRAAARSVNAIMTATYWEIGRRIVELEQRGESRAEYGKQIIERLAKDLSDRFAQSARISRSTRVIAVRVFPVLVAITSRALRPFFSSKVSVMRRMASV